MKVPRRKAPDPLPTPPAGGKAAARMRQAELERGVAPPEKRAPRKKRDADPPNGPNARDERDADAER